MKTIFLTAIGFLFLALGAVGLALPVWPTTPFVLIAAGCFSGTPKLRAQLMRIRFFREYIENYASRAGLTRRTVRISLCYLWGMLLISMLIMQKPWLYALLPCVGTAVTVHICLMARPKKKEDKDS